MEMIKKTKSRRSKGVTNPLQYNNNVDELDSGCHDSENQEEENDIDNDDDEEEYEEDTVPSWRLRDSQQNKHRVAKYLIVMLILIISISLIVVFSVRDSGHTGTDHSVRSEEYVIAFGSCTSYDTRDQPIWKTGVIPTSPDAWIWAGDMAYLDDPFVDCSNAPFGDTNEQCQCDSNWLAQAPHSCMAASSDHALARWEVSTDRSVA